MKRILIGTALALFGLAPAIGSACEYNDASASATLPTQLGMASPSVSKAPAPVVAKAPLFKQAKAPAGDKPAPQSRDAKVVKASNN